MNRDIGKSLSTKYNRITAICMKHQKSLRIDKNGPYCIECRKEKREKNVRNNL